MNLNRQIEHWLADTKKTFSSRNTGSAERPFITLCYAQSWDGSITIRSGETLTLSSQESTCLTHQLRSMHEGILVGIGTVLTDDPQLTVRQWSGPDPQTIVLDSHLRIPGSARLCNAEKRCWVLTTCEGWSMADEGPEILTLQADAEGRVCLQGAMKLLHSKGITSLMVEGGANIITAFLKARLADAVVLTIAPTLVGGYKAVNDLGITAREHLPQISPLFTGRLGDDVIMWGNLHYSDQAS